MLSAGTIRRETSRRRARPETPHGSARSGWELGEGTHAIVLVGIGAGATTELLDPSAVKGGRGRLFSRRLRAFLGIDVVMVCPMRH